MYDYYCVMLYMISEDKVDNIHNTIFIYYLFIYFPSHSDLVPKRKSGILCYNVKNSKR